MQCLESGGGRSLDLGLLHHVDVDLVEHIGIVFRLAKAQAGDVHVLQNTNKFLFNKNI